MRRTGPELLVETAQALEKVLTELGLPFSRPEEGLQAAGTSPADFVVEIGENIVVVEVKPVVTAGNARSLIELAHRSQFPLLVASERIAEQAQEDFRLAGVSYFDRRGRLRLVLKGVFVDAEVSERDLETSKTAALSGETAKEVALVILSEPNRRHGVREIARTLDRSPSLVSVELGRLRTAGLATSANEPLNPDLFWELEAVWYRETVPLAAEPSPNDARRSDPLLLGLGHGDTAGLVLSDVGWALTDTLAAVAWGAPLVASGDYPPDFYVPSAAVLSRAVSTLGRASLPDERACTAAVAPARIVCRSRVTRPGETWPVANHVVVALDLAKDRARGREALDRWNPKDVARVW